MADSAAPVVVWFRRDLRLDDHPALMAALETGRPVVPLLVVDPGLEAAPTMGSARWARFVAAIVALDRDLRGVGSRLVLRRGDPRIVVPSLFTELGAVAVFASRDVTPYAVRRDRAVEAAVPLRLLPGTLVVEPEATGATRAFTPFHRRWLAADHGTPLPPPSLIPSPHGIAGEPLPNVVPQGGPEADQRLMRFAMDRARSYALDRDRLDRDGTSSLSADLHFGTISGRRVASVVDVPAYRRQLAWRDWAHHLLWFEPSDGGQRTAAASGEIHWQDDPAGLDAWREGRTGYPTVDAAMRQLASTGTMHNRARMIVASFLTKDLLIDWRVGEAHFLRHLVDADVANNRLGWRWTAGVGPDAAPFFRIFNPVLQGRRFDPDGAWVRRWVPEIAHLPSAVIHEPWAAPGGPPPGYPTPIVEHASARERALAAVRARERPRLP